MAYAAAQSNAWCSYYDASASVWPARPFPGFLFPQKSHRLYATAKHQWETYERVESQDAATRLRLSGTGWRPPPSTSQSGQIWYVFNSNEELRTYRNGQLLHAQFCPNQNWQSQRLYGVSATQLQYIWPTPGS